MSIKEEIHGLTDEMLTNLGRLVAMYTDAELQMTRVRFWKLFMQ